MAGDIYYESVVLLLNCVGANDSTVFTDESLSPRTVTAYGNAKITSNKLACDGTGDYLLLDGNSILALGTGDYTIEMLLKPTATGQSNMLIDFRNGNPPNCFIMNIDSGIPTVTSGIAALITGTTVLSASVETHVAVSRVNGLTKLFVAGVQEGATTADPSNLAVSASRPSIGINGYDASSWALDGTMRAIRITKGIGRYTGTFTPPSSTFPAYAGQLTGNITESLAITDWDLEARRYRDHSLIGTSVSTGTTYSVNCTSIEPTAITIRPRIDGLWKANTYFPIDYLMASSTPDAHAHIWKCTANGSSDPFYANSVLQLHFNGTDTSTTFTDNSPAARTATVLGNAQISTAQSVFGGASGLFDGTGDGITFPNSADFNFTGDFTLSFRVWFTSIASYQTIYAYGYTSGGLTTGGLLVQTGNGNGRLIVYLNGTAAITESGTASTSTWIDYELARSGNTITLRRDGTSSGSTTAVISISSTEVLAIGARSDGVWSLNGRLDELQVLKGAARHTADYTSAVSAFSEVACVTGASEPTLALSGTTVDNGVTWTYIAPLIDPVTLGPKIPT